jgi:hypothetical protein
MLSETFKKNMATVRSKDPNVKFIDVTRTSNSPLSPSWDMYNDYKYGRITWDEYVTIFKEEMKEREIESTLRDIAIMSLKKNVYLVCYETTKHCHRFILLDMIAELAENEAIPVVFGKSK